MNHRGIWLTASALAVIVLLAQVAGASTRDASTSVAAEATVSASAEMTTAVATISLSEQASSEARENSAKGIATANHAKADHAKVTTSTELTEVPANAPAAAPQDSSTGARPGFGCGDANHKHSGPPGRPGATPPPGCASR